MPALSRPQYGVDKLYMFPVYMTPEIYKSVTGKEAPVWNPALPPKYWEDLSVKSSPRRTVIYDRALVYDEKGYLVKGRHGKPVIDVLVLRKDQAAAVNIPPSGANVEGADRPPVPPPLRALETGEEMIFGFGSLPVVRNKDEFAPAADGFMVEDRQLLHAIAEILGV